MNVDRSLLLMFKTSDTNIRQLHVFKKNIALIDVKLRLPLQQ